MSEPTGTGPQRERLDRRTGGPSSTLPPLGWPDRALGTPRKPWREQVLARVAVMDAENATLDTDAGTDTALAAQAAKLHAAVANHLDLACEAATGTGGRGTGAHRARMERAFAHVDEAEAFMLRRGSTDYLRGHLPALLAHVRAHLVPSHPQRIVVEEMAGRRTGRNAADLDADDRVALVNAMRTASWAARREHARLRSFRNIVVLTSVGLLLLAVVLAGLSALNPRWMPLCFAPQAGTTTVVCPTASAEVAGTATEQASSVAIAEVIGSTAQPYDAVVVMLLGLAAAAVTGAAALRRMRGTSTPFAVPMALLALKLPTGALTAFLGLILLHGEFVPGLSALDSSGQILAWALLFGAAQQLVTGLVDKKAQSVLDSVGSTPMTGEKE